MYEIPGRPAACGDDFLTWKACVRGKPDAIERFQGGRGLPLRVADVLITLFLKKQLDCRGGYSCDVWTMVIHCFYLILYTTSENVVKKLQEWLSLQDNTMTDWGLTQIGH